MDPITLGALGLGGMFVLIALHVPIGVAMGITGVTSVAFIIGWEPALSLLGTEPSAAIENEGLAVVALLFCLLFLFISGLIRFGAGCWPSIAFFDIIL